MNNKYFSDLIIKPGESIVEMLEEFDMNQKELATRMGYTPKHINRVIQGKDPITAEFALRLESVFSMKASFWLNLEANYQEQLIRVNEMIPSAEELSIARLIPYAEMAQLGWVEKTRKVDEKVYNLREHYCVSNLENIEEAFNCAFREKGNEKASKYAQSAWVAEGEKIARNTETKPFDKDKLKLALPNLRKLTLLSPEKFVPELISILKECGIVVAFVPKISHTYAHGATKWMTSSKLLIQLSLRGKYADIFWFSLFHEIAHVLIHGKKVFEEEKDQEKEAEADVKASDIIIPRKAYKSFVAENDFSMESIKMFAKQQGIHCGLVAGRLAYENLVEYRSIVQLRDKYSWVA